MVDPREKICVFDVSGMVKTPPLYSGGGGNRVVVCELTCWVKSVYSSTRRRYAIVMAEAPSSDGWKEGLECVLSWKTAVKHTTDQITQPTRLEPEAGYQSLDTLRQPSRLTASRSFPASYNRYLQYHTASQLHKRRAGNFKSACSWFASSHLPGFVCLTVSVLGSDPLPRKWCDQRRNTALISAFRTAAARE